MTRPIRNLIRSLPAALLLAASIFCAQPAQAATSYESDGCTSSGNKYCFVLYYNSVGSITNSGQGSCYISNRSVPDHYGYSPNGATLVRLVFHYGMLPGTCTTDSGDGTPLKNNAASMANAECGVYNRVYWGSGYQSISQAIYGSCGGYGGMAENLVPELKNENASHKRY
ncbi:hypothetical protein AB0H86_15160 [Streptomyces sp. NPDC050997]|uniref:hypothetical protein n=1 Tax=Streptomyces sp. NPDC050997 TaxID=3155519 RepID=UPI0034188C7F